ncbi:sigma-70 family RNA polymerase sigma factor [uncultured Jatrophihabitans sp.]|uniref:sigma-70 family RNA polymerase sigma factor n=1 Tax=uncultured Jatrophihabitans sp. TaxID=1610747 RepID=UPI0035CAAA09
MPQALQSLAVLVNDALAALDTQGPQIALSVAGTPARGHLVAQSALETTAPARRRRPARGPHAVRSAPNAPSDPDADSTDAVDDDHVAAWQLVRQAQAGDGDAFGQLYDRYVDMVFRFIYYRVNDRALAEDFTSETFLRALRRIKTFTYQGRDIGAWFVTIARNIVLDHVKSARNRLESTTAEAPERDHAPSTENAVLAGIESATLIAAIEELGDEQRECVMLRFIHGMSVSETASVMGKNDGAVKALQHRAVRKLADLVRGEL